MFTHRVRLLLIGAFLTVALAATLLLEAPEATRTVDEVVLPYSGFPNTKDNVGPLAKK